MAEKGNTPPAQTQGGTKAQETAQTQETEAGSGKIKVTVTQGQGSGSFVHPVSKQLLLRGAAAQLVPSDSWTDQMIRDKYLTEIRK